MIPEPLCFERVRTLFSDRVTLPELVCLLRARLHACAVLRGDATLWANLKTSLLKICICHITAEQSRNIRVGSMACSCNPSIESEHVAFPCVCVCVCVCVCARARVMMRECESQCVSWWCVSCAVMRAKLKANTKQGKPAGGQQIIVTASDLNATKMCTCTQKEQRKLSAYMRNFSLRLVRDTEDGVASVLPHTSAQPMSAAYSTAERERERARAPVRKYIHTRRPSWPQTQCRQQHARAS